MDSKDIKYSKRDVKQHLDSEVARQEAQKNGVTLRQIIEAHPDWLDLKVVIYDHYDADYHYLTNLSKNEHDIGYGGAYLTDEIEMKEGSIYDEEGRMVKSSIHGPTGRKIVVLD